MGTDGGKFDVSDRITADRLTRKTVLVDTGANIGALAPTPGQLAFCTLTGSGFTAGVLYERNAANSAWVPISVDGTGGMQGDILTYQTDMFKRKAKGVANTFLRSNQLGTDIEFAGVLTSELGRASGTTLSVTNLTAFRNLVIIARVKCSAVGTNVQLRFNNDSGNNYAHRRSVNGAADSTGTSTDKIILGTSDPANSNDTTQFAIYVHNYVPFKKACYWQGCVGMVSGISTAPDRVQGSAKWDNSSQITRVDLTVNTGTIEDGLLIVYGSD